jgi:N-hydroxyarylamine O-acetyltransferase
MDLDPYCARIGYDGAREPSRAVLTEVARRHAHAIVFENLDAFTGHRASLVPADVERKLVQQKRGGWCFEQNLLLGEALRALGFEVTDLAARVIWNRPLDAVMGRTHRLLRVRAEGRDWIADAGFGGQTLTGVLDLHSEESQATSHEAFRLRSLGEERVIESEIRGEWLHLCRFDLHPQLPIDFEAPNFMLSLDPASHFTQIVVASRVLPEGRVVLRGRELAFHALHGETRREDLGSVAAMQEALQDVFGLPLTGLPDLPARLARLFG